MQRFAAALIALTLIPSAVAASPQEVETLVLHSGHSMVLPAPGLSRVAVGDGRIAGVVPIGRSEVIVNGKSPGRTTLFVWRGSRRMTYEVSVSEQTIDDVASMIRSTLPNPNVEVVSFGHSVVLKGVVQTPEEFNRIDEALRRFDPDAKANKYTLVNAVSVSQPLGDLQGQLTTAPGFANVHVDRDLNGNLVVSGRVPDRIVAERVLEQVRHVGGTSLPAGAQVIDRLGLESPSQVDVKVYILEVDETALQQLGVRLQSGIPDPTHPGTYILSDPTFPAQESVTNNGSGAPNSGPAIPGRGLNIGAFYRTTILAPTLDLVMRNGHARLLSSPDLVTMPGQEATFLVGGQIPIPYQAGFGQIAIQYKEFGVRLQVTPTILGNGGVETKIAPEVSDLDFADGVQISGFTIPALKTSRIATDVVTHDGESIVMGGLLRRQELRNIDKIPFLGDIPILGRLFRSVRYQRADTDVVFVMTPSVLTR